MNNCFDIVEGINESPETKTCESSCQQRAPQIYVAVMSEVLDECVVNSKVATQSDTLSQDSRIKSKVEFPQAMFSENPRGHLH